MFRTTLPVRVFGLALFASVAVACGGGAGATTRPSTAASPAPSAPAASASTAAMAVEIDVATGTFGQYLTGADGKSLYLFMHDSVGTSTCTGGCATKWPAFVLETGDNVTTGTGVTGTIANITTAASGTGTQVTINGLPLYYFSGDSKAGDVNGQGFGGIWFLAGPAGTPVGAPASGAPASGAPSSGAPASSGTSRSPAPAASYGYGSSY